MEKHTKEEALVLLQTKYRELCDTLPEGERRFPKRSDFAENEVSMIKSFLGPWPRALEAAGIKQPSEIDRKEKNREKRIRAKRIQRENNKKEV